MSSASHRAEECEMGWLDKLLGRDKDKPAEEAEPVESVADEVEEGAHDARDEAVRDSSRIPPGTS
jgi:hypothetical protein